MKIIVLLLKLLISIIVGQTLFFKFSGADESVYIFTKLGVEPWGRIALGVFELLSVILLWIPKTSLYSLMLILSMMSGAIASHVFILGIEILGDGGELFILALVTWVSTAVLLYWIREQLKTMLTKLV